MKKYISLFLTLVCVLSLIGCNKEQQGNKSGVWSLPTSMESVEVEDPITYLLLRMEKKGEYDYIINVWENENGQCQVNYNVEQHKEGVFDKAVFHNITAIVNNAKLDGFERTAVSEGDESATLNVTYQSGKTILSDLVGQVPEDFKVSFEQVNEFFLELMTELPLAEIKATVEGEVNEEILAEINAVLKEVKHLDNFHIFGINDEDLSYSLGLKNTENVVSGAVCAPEMSTTLFRLKIVSLNDTSNVKSTAEDFVSNIDWNQWVCVLPDKAWIGIKDNLVLYVIGDDMSVVETAMGAKNAGWKEYESLIRR